MAKEGSPLKVTVLLPAYREENKIGELIRSILVHTPDVVVIDDGSRDRTAVRAEEAGAVVLRHNENRGKGEALKTGFRYARDQACDLVITMDADGQHKPDEIPRFVEAYRRTGIPILLGNRMADRDQMPCIRRWTNRIMSWMLSRMMKQYIPDTQCGFRMFRRDVLPFLTADAHRFAAESEMLLHLSERGFRIDSVRVSAVYRGEKSKIKPSLDTFRFFAMILRYRLHQRRVWANRG